MPGRDRYFIGETYGGSAAHRTSDKTIEWEWVHVGRTWALSHPLARMRGGMLIMLSFISICGAFWTYLALTLGSLEVLPMVFVSYLTLVALLRKWAAAWVLVWLTLLSTFPVSIPFIIYWADGVRPNLIYRHRFGRLVHPREAPDNVL
ncbi:MAG: hypothetical protein ABJN34_11720 [Litoreibacter sp.]|uniref:hypothetical protein n=1 Tax=Litoreibacter sp. TaxID=1969459 RepID=UPI003297A318